MKRDMDLIRKLLLTVEEHPYKGYEGESSYLEPNVDGHTCEEVEYHTMLVGQAGLLETKKLVMASGKIIWRVQWLTWVGHEFLDAARDQGRWEKAKNMAQEKAGSLTFDVLKALLVQLTRQAVGL